MTSKGQFTLPVQLRRDMGLDKKGAKAVLLYDKAAKRVYFEKPMSIQALTKMNQSILKRQDANLESYTSGDGFRAHVARKYSE